MTDLPPDPIDPIDDPESEPLAPARWAAAWRWARLALQVGLPIVIAWLVWHEIHTLDLRHVRAGLAQANFTLVGIGIGIAFLAVGVMGLYDAVAFPRGAKGTLSFPGRWLLGSVLFGWTNFVSMGPLGGPALRLFAYRKFGLTGPELTRGFVGHYAGSAAGLAAWLIAAWMPGLDGVHGETFIRIGIALVASVAIASIAGRAAIALLQRHHYGSELEGIALAPLGVVAFLDWGLSLLAFGVLIRAVGIHIDPTDAARTVFTGQFAGLATMIPGGLGSADAVWFKGFDLLGVPHDAAAAGVVVFRAAFYLAPWLAALAVIYTALAKRSERVRLWQRRVVAGAVILNAILLLLSAATPAVRDRLNAIENIVPLGAIEVSHLVATLSAGLMLFLARGLLRGYRGAYTFTMALLAASAIAHPLKGGDVEEGISSITLMILLFGVRGAFTRRGRVPVGWEVALAAAVASVAFFLVAGFAAFDRIPYKHELWTTFAERAEASRFLRAAVLLGLASLVIIIRQATRPANLWITPTPQDIERATSFAREHADAADALLVGAGDKGVWFWEPTPGKPEGLAIFQRKGDKLIVFKDPVVAPRADPAKLLSALLRYAESLDVDLVFAMVSGRWMEHLHDFGFHFLKINEEAVVPLEGFTLDGGRNANFRRTIREMDRTGITYQLLDPPIDDATIHALRDVSDAWLSAKGSRETQFSACYFSPAYMQGSSIGLARDPSGKPIAFVNVLITRPGSGAIIDLMRYTPDAPEGAMEFVLLRTMLALTERGIATFSLGGAPLSDVGIWRDSRIVERALHVFSLKAEHIYNYRGLLHFKNKFHPVWHPRYLAYQQPWDWASALVANTRLVQARTPADRHRIAAARIGAPTPLE